jgi:calnexin
MMAVHYHSLIVFLLYGHLARASFEPLQLTSEQEGGVYLLEQWATPDSLNSWTSSTLDKYRQGSWKVAESAVNAGLKGNLGLVMVAPTAHYALGRTLRAPASAHVKPLVLQYEVKQTTAVECGGAYVKLLPSTDLTTLSSTTDYVVMFGPDRCGPRDRVHFIIRRFDDQSRTWTEHQLTKPPKSKDSDLSVLYTLIIRPDSSFSISIDLDEVRTGSLLADGDFEPPLTQGATMDDPTDIKPDDWDDRETYVHYPT